MRLLKKIFDPLSPTAFILLYHRVADVKDDPHLLTVSPKNFYRQINYLRENFNLVSLLKLVNNLKGGEIKKDTLAITFDDGYADNLYNALPVLEEFQIPATLFIVAGKIDSPEPFWWDTETEKKSRGRPLSKGELIKLSNNNLIEIGSHTLSHPNLSKISYQEQEKEISESKKLIENIIKKPTFSFAYPFGSKDSFDKKTIELVKEAGYQYACVNIHKRVRKNSNIFALPRYIVRNWDLEEFKNKIKTF